MTSPNDKKEDSQKKYLDLTLNSLNRLSIEIDPALPDLDLSLRDPTTAESWHGDVCTFHLKLKGKQGKYLSQADVAKSPKEGWGWVLASPKWHYFVDNRSLCGKWLGLGLGELEQGKDEIPDNCTGCRKALLKRKAAEAVKILEAKKKIEF
jgi:hypothetical protein